MVVTVVLVVVVVLAVDRVVVMVVVDLAVVDVVVVDVAVVDVVVMDMAVVDVAVMDVVVVDKVLVDKGARGGHGVSGESSDEDTEWSDTLCTVNVLEFSEPVGPSIPLGDPTTTFLALFTPELLDHIVRETNRYAEQCISATHEGDGPPPTWTTTVDEIKAFIGFAI